MSTDPNTGPILSDGNYTITVIDANLCEYDTTMILTEPNLLALSVVSYSDISCFNACDASVISLVSGGTNTLIAGYQYLWKNPAGVIIGTGNSISELCNEGTYILEVWDANGCQASPSTISQLITEPAEIIASITASDTGAAHPPFSVMFDANVTPIATYNFSYNISVDGEYFPGGSSTTNPFWVTFTNHGANEVIFEVEDILTGCIVNDTIIILSLIHI